MPKIMKEKLSWKPSDSDQVIGYKLYWSKGDSVDYDSNFFILGDVSEIILPDVLKHIPSYGESIVLGIVAIDKKGNESDIATLLEPYQPAAPPAPTDLLLTPLNDAGNEAATQDIPEETEDVTDETPQTNDQEDPESKGQPPIGLRPKEKPVKYYDDVGFRKFNMEK